MFLFFGFFTVALIASFYYVLAPIIVLCLIARAVLWVLTQRRLARRAAVASVVPDWAKLTGQESPYQGEGWRGATNAYL